jgi:tight adherence protein C
MTSMLVIGCGLGWGLLAAMPVVQRAQRSGIRSRLGAHTSPSAAPARWTWDGGPVMRVARGVLRRRRHRGFDARIRRELPTVLDLLGVAVGAGSTPLGALETVARWGPPAIVGPIRRGLVAIELGGSLAEALRDLSTEFPALAPVADALLASARLGAPAGPALARLGDESRSALRRQAEARARTLPVKLLFPLVFLVLPAFGLLTVAPAVLSALSQL